MNIARSRPPNSLSTNSRRTPGSATIGPTKSLIPSGASSILTDHVRAFVIKLSHAWLPACVWERRCGATIYPECTQSVTVPHMCLYQSRKTRLYQNRSTLSTHQLQPTSDATRTSFRPATRTNPITQILAFKSADSKYSKLFTASDFLPSSAQNRMLASDLSHCLDATPPCGEISVHPHPHTRLATTTQASLALALSRQRKSKWQPRSRATPAAGPGRSFSVPF
jgi:hypothetical protein